jgi:hypothetical protein
VPVGQDVERRARGRTDPAYAARERTRVALRHAATDCRGRVAPQKRAEFRRDRRGYVPPRESSVRAHVRDREGGFPHRQQDPVGLDAAGDVDRFPVTVRQIDRGAWRGTSTHGRGF